MSVTTQDVIQQKIELDRFSFEPPEAYERLKIARGYYAMYHLASDLFNSSNKHLVTRYDYPPSNSKHPNKRYTSHKAVYMSLLRSNNENLIEVGKKLMRYHDLRCKADYDLHLHITEDDISGAEDCLKECTERIDYHNKNGNIPFSRASKVILVNMGKGGVKKSHLKVINK